ncbi:MAG TPA: hypothetical protein VEF76_06255 [Patescibacteria group bacterium]|nr:hypothetical protein [Patescibacteria group bacterium]
MNFKTEPVMHLSDRCVVNVTGEDAFEFLQNIVTNDIRKAQDDSLVYACLLMPQGFYLHEFFVGRHGDGFFLDCEITGEDDLLRRLAMFRLRAKVVFERSPIEVYAGPTGLPDPRYPSLPRRNYGAVPPGAEGVGHYHDVSITLGIPCGSRTIVAGRDTLADVNLDLLNAIAWDKGCFIGQEVAARMYHRNIAKRRIVGVAGQGLTAGAKLFSDGREAGEIRTVSTGETGALAQIKSAFLTKISLSTSDGALCAVHIPSYLPVSPEISAP